MRFLLGWAFLLAAIALALQGCASAPERYCPGGVNGDVCYVLADAASVDRHCRAGAKTWDDGKIVGHAGDTRYARCCTVFDPMLNRDIVFVSRGMEDCIPHEECHRFQQKQEFPNHASCEGKGWRK